jgi:NAD(P)-dependent dehydrogenase (short-subunit alcohol dehydrogenase family)
MDSVELAGMVVIVTGASSGIGAAAARLLHAAGAHPVLAARRADRLQAVSADAGGALAVTADVTSGADVRRIAQEALARHGRIDALVNNAGISLHCPLDQLDPAEFSRVLDVNVVSMLAMTQAVLPAMRSRGYGRIVNVGSGATRIAPPGVGGYAATKAAVGMLTEIARKELAGDGIAVSLVVPSITATEFAGGRFQGGGPVPPGMVAHSPEYVGRIILRALRTGEPSIDIPRGPEQPALAEIPASWE